MISSDNGRSAGVLGRLAEFHCRVLFLTPELVLLLVTVSYSVYLGVQAMSGFL